MTNHPHRATRGRTKKAGIKQRRFARMVADKRETERLVKAGERCGRCLACRMGMRWFLCEGLAQTIPSDDPR